MAPRSSCSPPTAASTAAQPTVPSASPGATKRIRPSTTRRRARGASSRSTRRAARRSRSVPPTSASGSSTCSATAMRSRSSRTIRASAAGIIRRIARLDFAARTATTLHQSRWQLLFAVASPSGTRVAFLEGWSSDRGLVASEITHSRPRVREACRRLRRRGVGRHDLRVARRGEPLVRRLVEARLDLRHGPHRRQGRLVAIRRRDHRPQQLFRADLADAGQDRFRCRARDGRRAAGDRVQGRCRGGLEADHQAERRPSPRTSTTIRKCGRSAGRARTAWSSTASSCLPRESRNRAAADDRRHPWRPELDGEIRLQSRLRAAASRRRLRGVPSQLPRQYRLGPGFREAQHRRPRRRRVRGHPCSASIVHRRGLCRSGTARRHRRELWRLYDRLGRGDHQPLQGRGDGLRHRQPDLAATIPATTISTTSSMAARSATRGTDRSLSTARR